MTNKALRQLLDFELEAAGWSTGQIREVRRYLVKGTKNAHQRRLVLKYQQLRRDIVAKEDLAAEKAAKHAERYVNTHYSLEELDQIPDPKAREAALKLAALWEQTDGGVVPFPGIVAGQDLHDHNHKVNYYLRGQGFTSQMPPMWASGGRLTQRLEKVYPHLKGTDHVYRYCTVSLRTALGRARNGKDLFAWGVER